MKNFNRLSMIVGLISMLVISTGCGKKSSDTNNVGNGTNGGYMGGIVTPTPGGGVAISFALNNAYNSGTQVSAGAVTGSSKCSTQGCYCDYTSLGSFQCWTFANSYRNGGSGTTSAGASMPVGQPGSIVAPSKYEVGSGLTLALTQGSDLIHSNGSGVITLSPQFVQFNYPQGMPPFVSISLDLVVSGGTGFGGALIFTQPDSLGHTGRFLRF